MESERVTSPTHSQYDAARELYQNSFPYCEQREAVSQETILQDDTYHFDLI